MTGHDLVRVEPVDGAVGAAGVGVVTLADPPRRNARGSALAGDVRRRVAVVRVRVRAGGAR